MRNLLASTLVGAIALSPTLGACGKGGPASAPATAEPAPAPAPAPGSGSGSGEAAPQPAAPGATTPPVLARVGDAAITATAVAAAVRARVDETGVAPSPKVVEDTVKQLVEAKLFADQARAEGFVMQGSDAEVAAAWLDQRFAPRLAEAVTADDIASYWRDRRRAARIIVASREVGVRAQQSLLKAIEALPDKSEAIFADFYANLDTKETEPAVAARPERIAFDAGGKSATGEVVAPPRVAGAAFALKEVGDISPPVALAGQRWAIVQLRAIHPGVPAADLTEAQLAEARDAIAKARAGAAVEALSARLRGETEVTIVAAEIKPLSERLMRDGDRVLRRRPSGARELPFDLRKWRKARFTGKAEPLFDGAGRDRAKLRKLAPGELMDKARENMPNGGP